MKVERIRARTALNRTGGFLGGDEGGGYTHSFNPAVGCSFARGLCGLFCYARGFAQRMAGAGSWGRLLLVKENAPEVLREELARAARRPREHPLHLDQLRIFSASTTDPCAPPVLEVYRRCLRVLAENPPGVFVLQTRSPAVTRLEEEIRALGGRIALSFTLETDDEELWRAGPAGAPGVGARRRAFERLASWPVRRHLAVAPCLPLADPPAFADWIARYATDATVDTFTSGDGSGGRRTASSGLPAFLAARGRDWRSEEEARALHSLLLFRMGPRAGWSAAGFQRLAALPGSSSRPGERP